MKAQLIAAAQSWPEIQADVSEYWYIYASMPVIAALIGYGTKIVAIEMLYRPMKFIGIGPFGWHCAAPGLSSASPSAAIPRQAHARCVARQPRPDHP